MKVKLKNNLNYEIKKNYMILKFEDAKLKLSNKIFSIFFVLMKM